MRIIGFLEKLSFRTQPSRDKRYGRVRYLLLRSMRLFIVTKILIRDYFHLQLLRSTAGHHFDVTALSVTQLNHVVDAWHALCAKPPKGFGKFYPDKLPSPSDKRPDPAPEKDKPSKGEDAPKEKKTPPPSSSDDKFSFDKKFSFNFGGSGDPNQSNIMTYALAATVGIILIMAANEMRYKEIAWKEFINNYLSRGVVEKLEVINKKWVKIKLHPGTNVDASVLWFNIGSVETFERNMENVQFEMNIEPSNFVPVVYKNQFDG